MLDVEGLARLTEAADGVAPLDEATLLAVRHRPEAVTVWGDERGFGLVHGNELALVVLPDERGVGLGRELMRLVPETATLAWSHGDHPAARALAVASGWSRARELWVMRRPASLEVPAVTAPHGVTLRGFSAGDEEEILRVNAAAFAHHPEQGSLTLDGLQERMREPWFSADGLITAWDDESGRLLAFHWTKLVPGSTSGEVYVVGVDPAAQGRGLGRLVTLAGLSHLVSRGVEEIHLYVEGDNEPALGLYSGLGFTHSATDTHVQYRRD